MAKMGAKKIRDRREASRRRRREVAKQTHQRKGAVVDERPFPIEVSPLPVVIRSEIKIHRKRPSRPRHTRVRVQPRLGPRRSFEVILTTYDRPGDALRLLRDIRSCRSLHDLHVTVANDASKSDYRAVEDYCRREGWTYSVATKNHGKHGYAAWLTELVVLAHRRSSRSMVAVLQDDVRLCSRFFDRISGLAGDFSTPTWTLQLLRDRGRDGISIWTKTKPRIEGRVVKTGWVDCLFVASPGAASIMAKNPPRISSDRWAKNPDRSTGFGEHHSNVLHAKKASLYQVRQSLIAHVGQSSTMHTKERRKNPCLAMSFVDGERVHTALLQREPVYASLASIPRRRDLLARVVDSLAPQVDELRVYLNGYPDVPRFLRRTNVVVARSQDHGDRGDAGKFYWVAETEGYVFTADDDLIYPSDYVLHLIRAIERCGRKSIVGVHGARLPPGKIRSYFRDREVYPLTDDLRRDKIVHVIGTGVSAFHSSTIRLRPKDFRFKFMADVHLAVAAARQRVQLVTLAHSGQWIRVLRDPKGDTLFSRYSGRDRVQTRELNRIR